jgi:chaperonin GroES
MEVLSDYSNIRVLNGKILARRCRPSDMTGGGIFVGWENQKVREEGIVLRIGGDIKGVETPPVEIGSHIVFKRFQGKDLRINGEDLLVIDFKEVIGVFHDE